MVKVFLIRHGERLDHADDEWQHSAHRVHDSPLTNKGKEQAKECASLCLKPKLAEMKNPKVVMISSPFVRCVVTARTILEDLNLTGTVRIKIEEGVSEANEFIRSRMFATHRRTHKINALTKKPRGMLFPVFLGPGDLIETAHPAKIDTGYRSLHKVEYSQQGVEILPGKKSFSLFSFLSNPLKSLVHQDERSGVFTPKLVKYITEEEEKLEGDEELVVLIVSHGALVASIAASLAEMKLDEKIYYLTTLELAREKSGKQPFTLVSKWDLPELVEYVKRRKKSLKSDKDQLYA